MGNSRPLRLYVYKRQGYSFLKIAALSRAIPPGIVPATSAKTAKSAAEHIEDILEATEASKASKAASRTAEARIGIDSRVPEPVVFFFLLRIGKYGIGLVDPVSYTHLPADAPTTPIAKEVYHVRRAVGKEKSYGYNHHRQA